MGQHDYHDHFIGQHALNKRFIIAILFNTAFVMLELGLAWFAHSSSLMADAIHNLGDVLSLVLALFANRSLIRAPTEQSSYGFKKMTVFAAMANALLLVFTCGILATEAVTQLLSPIEMSTHIVMWVASLGIVVNASTALLFRHGQRDLNVRAAYLHLFFDAIISLAVVCVAWIISLTHWWFVDPLTGLMIACIILRSSWSLLADSLRLILDGVPRHISWSEVFNFLQAQEGVHEVHDLHIWAISTQETALSAHLWMPEGGLSDEARMQLGVLLKEQYHIQHVTIQVEQDKAFCMDACKP